MNCREAENGLESHRGAELKAGQHLQPLLQQEGWGVGEEVAGLGGQASEQPDRRFTVRWMRDLVS